MNTKGNIIYNVTKDLNGSCLEGLDKGQGKVKVRSLYFSFEKSY